MGSRLFPFYLCLCFGSTGIGCLGFFLDSLAVRQASTTRATREEYRKAGELRDARSTTQFAGSKVEDQP
jgi:hypothetical protein